MGDFSLNDVVGQALAAWSANEQNKFNARLAQSREQIAAYDATARSQAQAAANGGTMPAWVPLVGLGLVAVVVYVAVR